MFVAYSPSLNPLVVGDDSQLSEHTLQEQQLIVGIHLDVDGGTQSLVFKGHIEVCATV